MHAFQAQNMSIPNTDGYDSLKVYIPTAHVTTRTVVLMLPSVHKQKMQTYLKQGHKSHN
jgi:hypothetical protein